jgi:hypothetical protein
VIDIRENRCSAVEPSKGAIGVAQLDHQVVVDVEISRREWRRYERVIALGLSPIHTSAL